MRAGEAEGMAGHARGAGREKARRSAESPSPLGGNGGASGLLQGWGDEGARCVRDQYAGRVTVTQRRRPRRNYYDRTVIAVNALQRGMSL